MLGDPVSFVDLWGLWTVYANPLLYTTPQGLIAFAITTIGIISYEAYKYWDNLGICYSKGGKQNIDNEYSREVLNLDLKGNDRCNYLRKKYRNEKNKFERRKIKIALKKFGCDKKSRFE